MKNSTQKNYLRQYINQLFQRYDTQKKGTLTFNQLGNFFSDLLLSVGINLGYGCQQQLLQVINYVNPSFNGRVSPQEIQLMFLKMLNYASNTTQQSQETPPISYQQYTTIPGHYINNMYPFVQMGGQVWGFGNTGNHGWNQRQ